MKTTPPQLDTSAGPPVGAYAHEAHPWTDAELAALRRLLGRASWERGTLNADDLRKLSEAGYAVRTKPGEGGVTVHPPRAMSRKERRAKAAVARRKQRPRSQHRR